MFRVAILANLIAVIAGSGLALRQPNSILSSDWRKTWLPVATTNPEAAIEALSAVADGEIRALSGVIRGLEGEKKGLEGEKNGLAAENRALTERREILAEYLRDARAEVLSATRSLSVRGMLELSEVKLCSYQLLPGHDHYDVWKDIFKNYPRLLNEIVQQDQTIDSHAAAQIIVAIFKNADSDIQASKFKKVPLGVDVFTVRELIVLKAVMDTMYIPYSE